MKAFVYMILLAGMTLADAWARKPAVEDFVGIESEQPDLTPAGTHVLFDFEKEVAGHAAKSPALEAPESRVTVLRSPPQEPQYTAAPVSPEAWPLSAWFGALVVLAMPIVTWGLTMLQLKRQRRRDVALPSNVTVLKPREQQTAAGDDIKKAS